MQRERTGQSVASGIALPTRRDRRHRLTTALVTSTLGCFFLTSSVFAQSRPQVLDGLSLGLSSEPLRSSKAASTVEYGQIRGSSQAVRATRDAPLFAGTIRGSVPIAEPATDITGSIRGRLPMGEGYQPSPDMLFQQAVRQSIPLRGLDNDGPVLQVGSESLYFDAASNSMKLRASKSREDAARAEVRAAKGAFLPQLAVGGDWVLQGSIDYSPTVPIIAGSSLANKPGSTLGASLTVPLFDGLKRVNALRAAQANMAAAKSITNDAQQQLYYDTATAALSVLRDRRIVRLREQTVDQRKKIFHAAERMFEERAVTRTDLALAAARVDSAQSGLEIARGKLAISESNFFRLTKTAPQPGMMITPPMALPTSVEEAAARAGAGSPRLKATQLAAVASKHQAYSELAAFLPQGNLVVEGGRRYDVATGIDRADQLSTMLRVRVPIFDGTSVPKYEAAKADARRRMFEAQDGRVEAEETGRNLFTQRQAILAQIQVLSRQITNARSAAKGMMIEREAGLRKISEVLDAEGLIAESEIGLADAEFERDRVGFQMLATAGELVPMPAGR